MRLQQLLSKIPAQHLKSQPQVVSDVQVQHLAYDSRCVTEGTLFFAIQGLRTDGNLFVQKALSSGAVGVVSQKPPNAGGGDICWIQVEQIRRVLALLSGEFYGQPSGRLELVGVTGTNGKTTTSFLIHEILKQEGPALLMGTVQTAIGSHSQPSQLTTPESLDLQAELKRALNEGCSRGVLEVSSHAIELDRVFGCRLPVMVFTNLTQDHLDFHGTLQAYFQTKAKVFEPDYNPGLRFAVLNGDDPWVSRLRPKQAQVLRFGFGRALEVFPRHLHSSLAGMRLELQVGSRLLMVDSPLIGRHNAYNLMAAVAACSVLEIADSTIVEAMAQVPQVPGRFEKVPAELPCTVVIDYAHTADALANVLKAARTLTRGKVFCVFGCGGDRDKGKRPQMGQVSTDLADYVIVTTDNPRSEDPERIVSEIVSGIPEGRSNFETVLDRREAILRVLDLAGSGDLVLLAGKGHETYQCIGQEKFYFSEREIVLEAV